MCSSTKHCDEFRLSRGHSCCYVVLYCRGQTVIWRCCSIFKLYGKFPAVTTVTLLLWPLEITLWPKTRIDRNEVTSGRTVVTQWSQVVTTWLQSGRHWVLTTVQPFWLQDGCNLCIKNLATKVVARQSTTIFITCLVAKGSLVTCLFVWVIKWLLARSPAIVWLGLKIPPPFYFWQNPGFGIWQKSISWL